ncbi:FMN-binding negative transcriptional regulator [Pseudomonas matsuisoli]|uniref:Transcriptional regulator n=1 Tax=Pseudomonas matsuisoli TaxID=1515666 RepID=A0A917PS84_9PSED|nr:FMN-binding negative transcriptional regulator [Pseudomonas matsuisoli]GGJ89081.1 transcriptional regulator [Pseudomonas matsuisoli]
MYVPNAFRQNDSEMLNRQIHEARLATLVSNGPSGLIASHVPLLFAEDEGKHGTLYGHLARGNPHWKALADGEALVIFNGPDAYITPSWYAAKAEHGKVVPTWNYIAVHAYGRAEIIEDAPRLLDIVSRLTDKHEHSRPSPWSVNDAPLDYIDGMLKAIVGFALPIERIEGKWKLGQNRSEADFAGVRNGLSHSADALDRDLSTHMPPA